ncbi:MAG TPA: DNA/RNA helicase domain-containing protein [Jatrophihabitans sp.]|uniref:HelD family protein n=1 Tax=Jatrophihabitans sp. TaxID=1932789 RepID=UPI002F18F886
MTDAAMAELLRAEQADLDIRYARLDELRIETARTLAQLRSSGTAGTPAARVERDAFLALNAQNQQRLAAVEQRLCIGRLKMADGADRYVGRIGLTDVDGVRLLLDWRAPAAQPFYRATPAAPDGVVSRRHLSTTGRKVTGISDEVLDLDRFTASHASTATLSADGALMLALNANRTGRMRDIVATIQAEQDEIIRAPLAGVLVVQGGPGTGKTVVALHRAAYLLYAHRDRLARSGVLVVGPNARFLSYIEQVLPSLGETGVVLATAGQLFPGIDAQGVDSPDAARIKGDLRMTRLLAAAVKARQRVPAGPRRLEVEGSAVTLYPRDVEQARSRAQQSRKPHNVARVRFVGDLLERLAGRLAKELKTDLDADTRAELVNALRESADVRREVNLCWMPLTPERLLRDLYADPDALAELAPRFSGAERRALYRPRSAPWTPADVALLDEAAELLGADEAHADEAAGAAAAERAHEVEYAGRVLDMIAEMEPDAPQMTTADALAERYEATAARRVLVDEAASDRSWAFGHVVVDEAQELSAMQWRLLMRRCPSRSMTVVGDTAQTGSPAGARSWGQMLDPYVEGRWRLTELTVNYRTPGRIMAVATAALAESGVAATAMTSAREGDWPPTAEPVRGELGQAVVRAVEAERAALGEGRLAVITAARTQPELAEALSEQPWADERLAVLSPAQSKGLEFDVVVLVEPAAILSGSSRGPSDLYVAMTRSTQRLRILHSRPLPAALAELAAPEADPGR